MSSILQLLSTFIELYTIIIIVYVVFSWLPIRHTRLFHIIEEITLPVLRPLRNLIPNMGGIDFSPLIIIIGSSFLQNILLSLAHAL